MTKKICVLNMQSEYLIPKDIIYDKKYVSNEVELEFSKFEDQIVMTVIHDWETFIDFMKKSKEIEREVDHPNLI